MGKFSKFLLSFSIKEGFLKSVFLYMSFTALAQVIPLLISPILTRIYSPSAFGSMTLFVSVVSFFSVFANGKYALALSLPKDNTEGIKILQLASLISIVFASVVFIAFWTCWTFFPLWIGKLGITKIFFLIGPSILFYSLSEILSYWLNRKELFKRSSSSQVIRTGVNSFNSLGGQFVFGSATLEVSQFLGHLSSTCYLLWQVKKLEGKKIFRMASYRELWHVAKKYSSFPKINMPHNFLDKLNTEGIVFLISSFFTSGVLGIFGLYIRIVKMPISVIGAAFGQVLFQRCIKIKNDNGEMKPFIKSTFKKLGIIATIPFIIMLISGPQLFAFVLGKDWWQAGRFAQITSPLILLQFIASPLAFLPIAVDRQKTSFQYNLVGNILQLIAYLVGSMYGDMFVALTLSTIFGCIYYVLYLLWLWEIADYKRVRGHEST